MNIVNTHNHRLVFCLDGDAPEKYIKKWNKFKQQCEGGNNKYILEQIKQNCKIKSNKKLQYLDREEGGLGGNDNTIHKQIRFRHIFMGKKINGSIPYFKNDNNIIFNEITSTNKEKWTYVELDDIIYAFIKSANNFVESKCVSGYIEMINERTFSDNYLNSDSE
jgi:hypothetical protein